MVTIDHIGIAVEDLEAGSAFWRLLGLQETGDETVEEQGVDIRFFESITNNVDQIVAPRLELLAPRGADTPIGRFLTNHGSGVQQIAFRVEDLDSTIIRLVEAGIQMIDEEPRSGADGTRVAFVHPRSTGGVLVELLEKASTANSV